MKQMDRFILGSRKKGTCVAKIEHPSVGSRYSASEVLTYVLFSVNANTT